jgi:hypothetical protein
VLYLRFVRKFHLHWEEDAPLVGAYAGFFWDGRVDSIVDLVKQPLLNPDEMNGGEPAGCRNHRLGPVCRGLPQRVRLGLDDPDPRDPQSSRRRGERLPLEPRDVAVFVDTTITFAARAAHAARSAGLKLFKDPGEGALLRMPQAQRSLPDPKGSLFTDYEFDAVGRRAIARCRLPTTRTTSIWGSASARDDDYKAKTEEFCGSFPNAIAAQCGRPAKLHA